jgi:hypothetical protein
MKLAIGLVLISLTLLCAAIELRAAESATSWLPVPSGSGASYRVQSDGCIDYWNGRRLLRQTPDGAIYLWDSRRWIPAGAVVWGLNNPPPRGLLTPGRLNAERDEYRRRYGQDLYFQYGPGHFSSS